MKKIIISATVMITLTSTSFGCFAHQVGSTNSFPVQQFSLAA
ncbi:hypothetical protein [Francisella uliginis]|nr:hypothetical protein [Francisella uliginis]